ncbi:Putative flippase GtrA (transmembrane translocase of bactoprenol-linked glucose) [Alkalibacterium subtropicum]|uniref:Putative flippase GtrA (Transmembrane translocase of bactoprenol-linked glucose) n=1 Tax=Alkalibacterium subtropicum TaxID=753702 RepID=A0A1I1KJK4_9LACT|nr:GtrA family protein [Alkalibacterium subtropicum]SFC57620.1 Putative flippase GtrA (transmembrane translocase of bactoprenol-linked glucose) [Alkalibacterium subtropicum]
MIKKLYARFEQFIDYFLFGLATAVIGISVFYVLNELIGWQYLIANAVSVITAILFSYTVNKRYVFKTKTRSRRKFFREIGLFVSVRITASLLNMLGLFILVRFVSMHPTWAKISVEIIIASTSYIISRRLIFKHHN